jgi:predicted negative regulator of RcsB-dependent stress response
MAYDLEEQEQIDELKAWWKQNGKMISTLVIGVLVAFSAYQGWHYFQNKQAVEASAQYQELTVTDEKDLKSIQAKSATLMDKFTGTPYAGRAALFAAKANYQANDAKSAKAIRLGY